MTRGKKQRWIALFIFFVGAGSMAWFIVAGCSHPSGSALPTGTGVGNKAAATVTPYPDLPEIILYNGEIMDSSGKPGKTLSDAVVRFVVGGSSKCSPGSSGNMSWNVEEITDSSVAHSGISCMRVTIIDPSTQCDGFVWAWSKYGCGTNNNLDIDLSKHVLSSKLEFYIKHKHEIDPTNAIPNTPYRYDYGVLFEGRESGDPYSGKKVYLLNNSYESKCRDNSTFISLPDRKAVAVTDVWKKVSIPLYYFVDTQPGFWKNVMGVTFQFAPVTPIPPDNLRGAVVYIDDLKIVP